MRHTAHYSKYTVFGSKKQIKTVFFRRLFMGVGKRIIEMARSKGVRQAQIAQKLGISQQTVSQWARGGSPTPDRLPALAELLGTTVDALLAGEEVPTATSDEPSTIARLLAIVESQQSIIKTQADSINNMSKNTKQP